MKNLLNEAEEAAGLAEEAEETIACLRRARERREMSECVTHKHFVTAE